MNARTTSVSTLALLAFAAVVMAQPARTTTNTTTTADTATLGYGFTDDGDSESIDTSGLTTSQHEFLKPFAGVWTGTATLFGVEGGSVDSTITCVSSLTFGRYLTTTFSGSIMDQPFEAVQTWGYNTATNSFETTWIDNNSTGITFNNGSCNTTGKVFTIDGQVEDVDGSTITQRSVTTLVDNDHFTLNLISIDSNSVETPVMTISFTRQANAHQAQTASNAPKAKVAVAPAPIVETKTVEVVRTVYVYRGVDVEVTSAQFDAPRTAAETEPKN